MVKEIRALKMENDRLEMKLTDDDLRFASRITKRLQGTMLCRGQIELVRRDIIGMGREAYLRGETLKSTLGTSEGDFCRTVEESGVRMAYWERFCITLRTILGVASCLLAVVVFIGQAADPHGVLDKMAAQTVLMVLVLIPCLSLVDIFCRQRAIRNGWGNVGARAALFLTIGVLGVLNRLTVFVLRGLSFPAVPTLIALLVLWGVAWFFCYKGERRSVDRLRGQLLQDDKK